MLDVQDISRNDDIAMDAENLVEEPPITLIDLLDNTLIWRQTAPYLPPGSVLALSATARALRHTVCESPETFRHLNLTLVKSAATLIDSSPIDSGGTSWRAERMDESLTEDDFFSGPLRGIFSKLERQGLLLNVKTMILDGLGVPAELVREIVVDERFNVKILSIRKVTNMNQRGLQSVLRYVVRPSAPRLPKLKGLYLFGPKDVIATPSSRDTPMSSNRISTGVMSSEGAQIGAEWNSRSEIALSTALLGHDQPLDNWWRTRGNVFGPNNTLKDTPSPDWADILLACQGVVAFDAVLCRGPRHDPDKTTPDRLLRPAIASIGFGARGCEICGSCPEQPAVFDRDADWNFPLLAPPPLHASTIRSAQRPTLPYGLEKPPPLILRCLECVRERWCQRCNKWWCEECYQEPFSRAKRHHPNSPEDSFQQNSGWVAEELNSNTGSAVKGVHRECIACGRTCEECTAKYIRRCRDCGNEYCLEHNEGSTGTTCEWCRASGRRTRELY